VAPQTFGGEWFIVFLSLSQGREGTYCLFSILFPILPHNRRRKRREIGRKEPSACLVEVFVLIQYGTISSQIVLSSFLVV
jgi:hypothetical protein